jgi:uncharacterized protein YegJ (DUF2314 family)
MTDFPEQYAPFVADHGIEPSTVIAYLPPWCPEPDVVALSERIAASIRVTATGELEQSTAHTGPSFRFVWGQGETALNFVLEVQETGELDFDGTFGLSDEEIDSVERSQWCICLTTEFGPHVLDDFHTQMKALALAAPEAVVMFDCASDRVHSGNWLRDVANSRVPPPPDSLYTVHVVTEPGDDRSWFHSHGLLRCGSIELEMLDIPEDAVSTFTNLFNVTGALFIEHGTPPPGDGFDVGPEIRLYWLPWEHAVQRLPGGELGRGEDRRDHDHPSGVLFVETADDADSRDMGVPTNVTVLRDVLEDEPILFHTQMETQRMSLLAKEHFPRFRALQRRFAEDDEWEFHVKLGYLVDDCPEDEDESEHLWFQLHEIKGGEMVATLQNEPYGIARMRAGDRDRHACDQLSDWSIECHHGLFDATTIGRLEDLVRPI